MMSWPISSLLAAAMIALIAQLYPALPNWRDMIYRLFSLWSAKILHHRDTNEMPT